MSEDFLEGGASGDDMVLPDPDVLERQRRAEKIQKRQQLEDLQKTLKTFEPKCKVCTSKFRDLIDKLAVEGYNFAEIARLIQDAEPEITRKNIERHIHRHLDIEQASYQRLLLAKLANQEAAVDDYTSRIVTRQALIDGVIQRGWSQLTDGSKIRWDDVLKAVELQQKMEEEQYQRMVEIMQRQMGIIVTAVREIVPEDLWPHLYARIEQLKNEEDIILSLPSGSVKEVQGGE